MTELAVLETDGPIATLKLNRPDRHNALSVELLDALAARVGDLEKMDEVRVLVLTGAGRSFCAGMDLKSVVIEEGRDWPGGQLLGSLARLTFRFRNLPMVTVAKVNGAAIGGGCGLSCVADICLTHSDSKMGFPEVDLGICPAVVAPWVVSKIGAGAGRRVLLLGGIFSGARAAEIGLVDHLAPDRDALDSLTNELCERVASGGGVALRETKRLLNRLAGHVDESVLVRGAELSARVLATPEAQGCLRARLR